MGANQTIDAFPDLKHLAKEDEVQATQHGVATSQENFEKLFSYIYSESYANPRVPTQAVWYSRLQLRWFRPKTRCAPASEVCTCGVTRESADHSASDQYQPRLTLASNPAPSGSLSYWVARKGPGGQYK